MNIDRIAREMVDVEPSADLEAKIRARIRAVPPKSESAWWVWRVAVPAAAMAAIAIASTLLVQRPAADLQAPVSPNRPVQEAMIQGPATAPIPTEPSIRPVAVKSSPHGRNATAELSAEELAWMDRRMPALDPVNALQVDRLRVDSIQPDPLAITPLTISPVSTEGSEIGRIDR